LVDCNIDGRLASSEKLLVYDVVSYLFS